MDEYTELTEEKREAQEENKPAEIMDGPVVAYGDPAQGLALQAGVNFGLLGTHLVAAFGKDTDGIKLLVMPTDTEAPWITIGQIVKDINTLLGKPVIEEKDISAKLEDLAKESGSSGFDVNKIAFKLSTVFLFYQKTAGEKPTSATEYAFSLEVDLSKVMGDKPIGLISMDSAFFSIWNTDRDSILSRMKIFDFKSI